MPTAASRTFTIVGLQPVYNPEVARTISVKLPVSVTYVKGQLMSEVKGANEVVTLTEGTNITAGSYTLTFGGQTTAAIQWDATAAQVQAALELLSSIGTDNIAVTGMAGGLTAAPATLTFKNDLGFQDVGAVTSNQGSLTGTFTIAVATAGSAGSPGTWKKYASASTDGSQLPPFGLLQYDAATDSSGLITMGGASGGGADGETVPSVPMYYRGAFRISECDAQLTEALISTAGWRIIHGTVYANGVVELP